MIGSLIAASPMKALRVSMLRDRVYLAVTAGVPKWLESVFQETLRDLDEIIMASRVGVSDERAQARAEARAETLLEVIRSMRAAVAGAPSR